MLCDANRHLRKSFLLVGPTIKVFSFYDCRSKFSYVATRRSSIMYVLTGFIKMSNVFTGKCGSLRSSFRRNHKSIILFWLTIFNILGYSRKFLKLKYYLLYIICYYIFSHTSIIKFVNTYSYKSNLKETR